MNINEFRKRLIAKLISQERSVNSIAIEYGVEQASLSRFINKGRGLSGEYVLALMPFVYGNEFNKNAVALTPAMQEQTPYVEHRG